MKLFFAILIAISTVPSSKEGAVLSFYSKSFSFPDVREGEILRHSFEFVNEGQQSLVITNYKVACSCTKLVFPKSPILPGERGEVMVVFDTNQKFGYQNRTVEVYSNASRKPEKLKIKVNVIPKDYE